MLIRFTYPKFIISLIPALLLSLPGAGFGEAKSAAVSELTGGLKTNYVKVAVDNLPIGQTVSMTKIANAPMVVGNDYTVPVFVEVHTEIPAKLREGYVSIPDPGWIVIEPDGLTLQAKSTVNLDVKVNIPDDEKLLGKKFQCDILVTTGGDPNIKGMRFGTQIKGFFMFSVAPKRNVEALDAVLKNPADAAYEILPPQVVINDVKPGQKIRVVTEANKRIQLVNHSKKRQQYRLFSVDPAETGFRIYENTRFAGNVNDVKLRQDRFKVSTGRKKDLDITIDVPQDADFTQTLAYLVAVNSGQQEGVTRYLAIYLKGKRAAKEEDLQKGPLQFNEEKQDKKIDAPKSKEKKDAIK